MHQEDEVRYHWRRALHELNLGLAAASSEASRAHLHLSSLHSRRLRSLQGLLAAEALRSG